LKESMIDVDIVIHTAALHGIHVSQGVSKENFIQTNINGTQNLLEVCSIEKIQKLIYTSTTSAYGAD
jgi:UDP-glucose 4-epimerase